MSDLHKELAVLLDLIERRERDVERLRKFREPEETRPNELFATLNWEAVLRDLRTLHARLEAASKAAIERGEHLKPEGLGITAAGAHGTSGPINGDDTP